MFVNVKARAWSVKCSVGPGCKETMLNARRSPGGGPTGKRVLALPMEERPMTGEVTFESLYDTADIVPGPRIELGWGCPHRILSPARLPVPPPGLTTT